MCQALSFKHLPMDGGLLDQHPGFLERMMYILQEQERHRQNEEAKKSRMQGGPQGKMRRSSRPSY